MNSKQSYSICLLIVASGCALASGAPNLELVEQWKDNYKSVFHGEVALEPEVTLDKLRHLDELFPQVESGLDSQTAAAWLEKRHSIKAADINPDRCSASELYEFDDLLDTFEDEKSIQSYLKYYKGEQFDACKSTAAKHLEEAVSKLPVETIQDIEMLESEVAKNGKNNINGMAELSFNALVRGVFSFLQLKQHKSINKGTKDDFEQVFDISVSSLCVEVAYDQLQEALTFYEQLVDSEEKEVDKTLEQNTIEWIIRSAICKELLEDKESYVDVAYELLQGLHKSDESLQNPSGESDEDMEDRLAAVSQLKVKS